MEFEVHIVDGVVLADPSTPPVPEPVATLDALETELLECLGLLEALEREKGDT